MGENVQPLPPPNFTQLWQALEHEEQRSAHASPPPLLTQLQHALLHAEATLPAEQSKASAWSIGIADSARVSAVKSKG